MLPSCEYARRRRGLAGARLSLPARIRVFRGVWDLWNIALRVSARLSRSFSSPCCNVDSDSTVGGVLFPLVVALTDPVKF